MIDVTCAIILNQGRILVTQRSDKMRLPLKWEFPGGKIEPNETAEACICRELREELNIEVNIVERLQTCPFHYETVSINLIPFVATLKNGQVILHEHKDFKWVETEQLTQFDWASADLPVLDQFLKSHHASRGTL
jgi:8-oxo-dGTP diphosphatase